MPGIAGFQGGRRLQASACVLAGVATGGPALCDLGPERGPGSACSAAAYVGVAPVSSASILGNR